MSKVNTSDQSGVISVTAFSGLTGLAKQTVINYCISGAIPSTMIPHKKKTTYLIPIDQVERFRKPNQKQKNEGE